MTIVVIEGKQESLREGTGLLGKMFQLAMKELFWVPLGCLAALRLARALSCPSWASWSTLGSSPDPHVAKCSPVLRNA